MNQIVFRKEDYTLRYHTGTLVYTERLEKGRWIAVDYHGAGMPIHQDERSKVFPALSAFELEIDGCDAAAGWEFSDFRQFTASDGREGGELTLLCPRRGLSLRIVTLCGGNGMLTRQLYLKNLTDRKRAVSKAAPLAGAPWEETDNAEDFIPSEKAAPFSLGSFHGRLWCMEGMFGWEKLPLNETVEFGSDTGKSGHGHPFAIVKNEVYGGYFLCQLEWSASWCFRFSSEYNFDAHARRKELRLRFSAAPKAETPMVVMDAGEELTLPAVHFGMLYGEFDRAIQVLHSYQRKYLLAQPTGGKEYVSYDGWGYHGSDYKEDILFAEIDRAAELGAEIYMVDAGWYGDAGTDWYSTTGDWNRSRLPHDLYPIIDRAHEKGMKFGLWVELESAGSQSDLAKEHPEWFAVWHGERVDRWLDLSNPKMERWITEQLFDIIRRYQLDLLRIDFNFERINGFRQNGEYEENILWRYTEALHRIFDRIRAAFPDLQLENCAAGGGRTDLGMMSRFSKTQISDCFRLPRGVRAFNGMSICLPPECLLMQYGRAINAYQYGSAEMQIQSSILGVPKISGIAPYDESINPALWTMLKKYIAVYKEFIRPIQRTALTYHHTPELPGFGATGWDVLEFVSPDKVKGYVYLARLPETKEETYLFRSKGLDMNKSYRLTFCSEEYSAVFSGKELRIHGIPVIRESVLTSELILIEEEDE